MHVDTANVMSKQEDSLTISSGINTSSSSPFNEVNAGFGAAVGLCRLNPSAKNEADEEYRGSSGGETT